MADWDHIAAAKRTGWQRLAAATRGIITPANLLSFGGAVIVVYGLILIADREILGAFYILIGRIADITDGFVARRTGTVSPLGEAMDATIDKILLLLAIIALWSAALVPVWLIILMLFHATINSVISLYAKLKKVSVHPVPAGKYSTAALWTSVVLLTAAKLVEDKSGISYTSLLVLGYICAGIFIYYAFAASTDYLGQLKGEDGRK